VLLINPCEYLAGNKVLEFKKGLSYGKFFFQKMTRDFISPNKLSKDSSELVSQISELHHLSNTSMNVDDSLILSSVQYLLDNTLHKATQWVC
jgi:hypothetical protein